MPPAYGLASININSKERALLQLLLLLLLALLLADLRHFLRLLLLPLLLVALRLQRVERALLYRLAPPPLPRAPRSRILVALLPSYGYGR